MSARDDSHGGRFEPTTQPIPGAGLPAVGRCDECHRDSAVGRSRTKVKRGPLRGLVGMVCGSCVAARVKETA